MALSRQIAELMVKKNVSVQAVTDALARYNLLGLLPSVKNDVLKLTREQGVAESVHIESPFELDALALSQIQTLIGSGKAETRVTINKDVLAGFKARYKGKLYDGSAERIVRNIINH